MNILYDPFKAVYVFIERKKRRELNESTSIVFILRHICKETHPFTAICSVYSYAYQYMCASVDCVSKQQEEVLSCLVRSPALCTLHTVSCFIHNTHEVKCLALLFALTHLDWLEVVKLLYNCCYYCWLLSFPLKFTFTFTCIHTTRSHSHIIKMNVNRSVWMQNVKQLCKKGGESLLWLKSNAGKTCSFSFCKQCGSIYGHFIF